jgi:glycosyltransferase involved in cell wall biosynthesis
MTESVRRLTGLLLLTPTGKNIVGVNKPILAALEPLSQHAGIDLVAETPTGSLQFFLSLVVRSVMGKSRDYDFILINGMGALRATCTSYGCPYVRLLEQSGLPVLIYWHESDWMMSSLLRQKPGKIRALRDLFQRCDVKHLAVSKLTADALRRQFGVEESAIVGNCVEIPTDYRELEVVPLTEPLTVINIASIQERKGPDLFVEVAARVCRENEYVRFIWLGDGADIVQLRQRVSSMGLAGRIQFPGLVQNPFPQLRRSHLLFLSSREDPCPLSVSEAMGSGRTVVTFPSGGSVETVAETGLVLNDFDTDHAAQGILDLLMHRDCAAVNGDAVRRYQENFTPEAFARRLGPLIRDVCSDGQTEKMRQ